MNLLNDNDNVYLMLAASVLPAFFIISASYAECNHLLVVIFFISSIGMHAFLTSGLSINPMDLSPNYAGTLMSLANGAGAITGIIAPYSVGLLTPNVRNYILWPKDIASRHLESVHFY